MNKQKTYIVVGASAAGLAAAQKIRQLEPQSRILCFSDEAEPPYNKCFLADFLGGHKSQSEVHTKSPDFLKNCSIELHLGVRVLSIDRASQTVSCSDGKIYSYDALLLGVGAAARKPRCSYSEQTQGIFSFYTYADACALKTWMATRSPQHAVVLGAGLTGLEVADALQSYGCRVTVIEQQPRLLMRHLDEEGASFVAQAIERAGVSLMTGQAAIALIATEKNEVNAAIMANGTSVPAQVVVAALGSVARLELLEQAGLAMAEGGVITNEHLRTNDPFIFAAGDVALVNDALTGERMRTAMWPDAVSQGMHAAYAMVGQPRPYPGVIPLATSTFFGMSFHSAGYLHVALPGWTEEIERTVDGYAKLVLDEQGVVRGFICLGSLVSRVLAYKRALTTGQKVA